MKYYIANEDKGSYLVHHGTKGQKWGIRKYQYDDGSLTVLGREHYGVGPPRDSGSSDKSPGSSSKHVSALLKRLKKEGYIKDVNRSMRDVKTSSIDLEDVTDLKIRDAILGIGEILEEDLDSHSYIATVKLGKNRETQAMISRDGNKVEISAYGKEGLAKQNLADKTIKKLQTALERSVYKDKYEKTEYDSDFLEHG